MSISCASIMGFRVSLHPRPYAAWIVRNTRESHPFGDPSLQVTHSVQTVCKSCWAFCDAKVGSLIPHLQSTR